MSCENIQEKIADEIAGHLDLAEAKAVRAHVDACAACRAFREAAEAIYTLDLGGVPSPLPSARLIVLDDRRPQTFLRVAAAAAILILGLFLGAAGAHHFRRSGSDSPSAPEAAVRPDPITVALPPFPRSFESAEWLHSAEDARRIGRYTGRPVLTLYTFADCPRCQAMEKYFTDPGTIGRLSRFVLLRVDVTDELPRELAAAPTPMSPFLMMPALVLATDDMKTSPAFEIDGDEMVQTFLKNWDAAAPGRRPPLDPDEFSDAAEFFGELPTMLARFNYAGIYRELDHIARLDERFATAFGELAREVRIALNGAIGRQIDALARAVENPETAAAARAKAAALKKATVPPELLPRLEEILR